MFEMSLVVQMPLGVDENNDFTKFQGAFKVEMPYGLRASTNPEPTMSTTLQISTIPDDPAALVHAIMRGVIRFLAATANEPAQLEFRPMPFDLIVLGFTLNGSTLPTAVIYSNIDPDSVQEAAKAVLTAAQVPPDEITARLDAFMAGTDWLTVDAGTRIGRPAIDPNLGGRRRLELVMNEQNGYYLNPAHFLFQWDMINTALANHPLLLALEAAQRRLLFATKGHLLFVQQTGSIPTAPYATEATAASKINDAIVLANPGDMVVVLDNTVYNEKIFMPDGVALTSMGMIGKLGRITENPGGYPTLSDPNSLSAAVVLQHLQNGPTHISGFIISGGKSDDGGGFSVSDSYNVEIAQNDIHTNQGVRGGGIGVIQSRRVLITENIIRDNQVADGSGIGSFAWGQGGGVYTSYESSEVTIYDNAIYRNTASNFGAGIAVFTSRNVRIHQNDIGGASSSDGNIVTGDRLPYPQSVVLDNPQGGGGGVGIYDASTNFINNRIYNNESNSGGGIEFYVNGGGVLLGNEIQYNRTRPEVDYPDGPLGGDGGGIAVNPTSLTLATADNRRKVVLNNNKIEQNHAEDDGGGIYATIKSIIEISGDAHTISNNSAQHNGGGVRVSTGSLLKIIGGQIQNNHANLETDPTEKNCGGGGIAARDSLIHIENCTITGNDVDGFAGGGVYFVTLDEGVTFNNLLTGAYRFTQAEIVLLNCNIIDNAAKGADHGAGGGLYVTYDQFNIHIRVDGTTLSPNIAEATDPAKRCNVVLFDHFAPQKPIENDTNLPPLTPLNGFEQTLTP